MRPRRGNDGKEFLSTRSAGREGGTLKVLIMDDDPDVRNIISETLRGQGFEAVTAGSADEAVACFIEGGRPT